MFYGTGSTNFMCSKCFKDDQDAKGVKPAASNSDQKTITGAAGETPKTTDKEMTPEEEKAPSKPVQVRPPHLSSFHKVAFQEKKNRCWACNKKVGLLGFECKCDYIFCAKHRHADDHNCDYDHKKDDLENLKKNNPLLEAGKVDKIL